MADQKNSYENEINIYDLWNVLMKRKHVIIAAFLLFTVSGTVISFLLPEVYRGSAVLLIKSGANSSAKEVVDFIGKINEIEIKTKAFPKTFEKIVDVKLNPMKDSKDKMEVVFETHDPNSLKTAFPELIAFVNNIDFLKMNLTEERERTLMRSSELTALIKDSAGLLHIYSRLLKEGKLMPVGFNPIDLNKRISDLRIEKLVNDQTLKRLDNSCVEVARQFEVFNKPIKPNKANIVVLSAIMGIFIGITLTLFMEFLEKNNNRRSRVD